MRKNIKNVASAFVQRLPHFEKNIGTDGEKIFSYEMVIAIRAPNKKIYIAIRGPTRTTNSHIAGLVSYCSFNKIPFECISAEKLLSIRL